MSDVQVLLLLGTVKTAAARYPSLIELSIMNTRHAGNCGVSLTGGVGQMKFPNLMEVIPIVLSVPVLCSGLFGCRSGDRKVRSILYFSPFALVSILSRYTSLMKMVKFCLFPLSAAVRSA